MTGNYPPGVTGADIDRHFGDHSFNHECEFEPVHGDYPIFEDWTATFVEKCYVAPTLATYTDDARDEVYEDQGDPCGNVRKIRFEVDSIVKLVDGEPLLVIGADQFDHIEETRPHLWEIIVEAICEAEIAAERGDAVIVEPDPFADYVAIEHDGFQVRYKP